MELEKEDEWEIDIGETTYGVSFFATAECSFQPGRAYSRNGDPGYPDDEEFELTSVEIISVLSVDDNNNDIEITDKEIISEVYRKLYNKLDDVDRWR